MANLSDTTTLLEALVAVLGMSGIAFSLWAAIDDLWDLSIVRREGVVGGPRWLAARGYLGLNVSLLCGWLGYTTVALIAANLPSAAGTGLPGVTWGDVTSVARLEYGGAVLVGQILQRVTRTQLRRLPRSMWDAFFGEATMWRERYLESQAHLHETRAQARRADIEIAQHRADKHDALNRETRATLKYQQLQRWMRNEGIVPPDFSTPVEPTEAEPEP